MKKKKKVLILGVTGQDGSFMAKLMLDKNYSVFGLVRKSATGNLHNINEILSNRNFNICHGDLLDLISIEKIIREIDNTIIQDVITFDVYEGDNIPKDKKSVAINVTLQAEDKTLSEKDLDQISKKIIEVVKEKTGATIRS